VNIFKIATATATLCLSGFAMANSAIIQEPSNFEAKSLIPSSTRIEVGNAGYGGALLWSVNPYVGLALGYNGGDISWSNSLKIDGAKYDWDQKNQTAYLNLELRPWGTSQNAFAQGFYIATGVAYLDNKYDLDRRVDAGRSFSVNNTDFIAGNNGVHINGKMKYDDDIAPYIGLGLAPKINNNWGVFGEIGAYYSGNPKVNLQRVSGSAIALNSDLDNEIANEANKIANKSRYEWLPVAKLGVNFYW